MNVPVSSAHQTKTILLVSDTENALRTEIQTLTALGASRFSHCSSGDDVLAMVKKGMNGTSSFFDVILCAESLGGEGIHVLLRRFADDKDMARLPFLVVASTPQRASLARRMGLVTLCRPYSQASFEESLSRAMSAMRKPLSPKKLEGVSANPALPKRRPQPKLQGTPDRSATVKTTSDLMREGLAHLRAGSLCKAEAVFTSLVSRSYDNAEAYLGLARVKGQQQNAEEAARSLVKAAAAFKRQKNHEKALAVYAMLPDTMQTGHIFLHEASLCLQQKEYREAALSILEHLYEHPEVRLHRVVGRLCQLTDAPDESLKKLCGVYTQLGYTSIARRLHAQLMAELTPVAYHKPSWLDRYPRLREAIEVASYTTALWRQA